MTTRGEQTTAEKGAIGGETQRLPRWMLLLGLTLLGAVAALFSSSRRSQFDRRWDDLDDIEPFEPEPPERREIPEPPSTPREIRGPAGKLFVDDGGEGDEPPVLFIHSLGGSAHQWAYQLDHLRPGRRAVALELRGHGRSDDSKGGGYGIADYAVDVLTVADELGLDRFVLTGHSLGGLVALDVASRYPERVLGLVLVDPSGDATRISQEELDTFLDAVDEDPVGEMRWYFKQILVGAEPEVADRVLEALDETDPRVFHPSLESGFTYAPLPSLDRYEGPVVSIVSSLNDLPHSLHNLRDDLEVRLLPGTSHWLMMDRPEAFNEAMDEFLAEVPEAEEA